MGNHSIICHKQDVIGHDSRLPLLMNNYAMPKEKQLKTLWYYTIFLLQSVIYNTQGLEGKKQCGVTRVLRVCS